MLTGPFFAPVSGTARQLIIFLHGYGANGDDLISMAPEIAKQFPDCAFVSPHAPHPCEMGFGRQWFSLADRSLPAMQAGAGAAWPLLDTFIDQEAGGWQVVADKVALVGFSQGAMMALAAGLQRKVQLASILGYSGSFLDFPITSKPPVLLVHGDLDDIVPVMALNHAVKSLRAADVAVESITRPRLAHGIDEVGVTAGINFLARTLGISAALAH